MHVKCGAHQFLEKSTRENVITCDSLIVVDKGFYVCCFVVENGVGLFLKFHLKFLETKSLPSTDMMEGLLACRLQQ